MKIEIFGSKIRDFYRRQRDRKKIENMWKVLTPLYYDPLLKGGYFAKKEKSVLSGFPVWFAADVCKDFNPYHSALDDKLTDEKSVFGTNHSFSKGDRISFRNLSANHAMSFVGLNLGPNKKPESWQVENSWGYWDNETPGEDGFLFMSHSWFEKNVMQIVVHKNYLSRTVSELLNREPEQVDPWDCVAPALKVKPVDPPKYYDLIGESIKRRKKN